MMELHLPNCSKSSPRSGEDRLKTHSLRNKPRANQIAHHHREHGMDYHIEGKFAFVNAGAHGIGEAIADLLTQEGAKVIVADRDKAALDEKAHRWTDTAAADLATAEGVEKATSHVLASFGRAPDILINNLGVGDSASFEELSDEQWARSWDINLMGCVRSCRAMIPLMAQLGSASVINM